MIKKENFREWSIRKWFRDREVGFGAIQDAIDDFCCTTIMTREERQDIKILFDPFWNDGGLDMAYQEYLERDLWERRYITIAHRLNQRFGLKVAVAFCRDCQKYHRFGRDLTDRFYVRMERKKLKNWKIYEHALNRLEKKRGRTFDKYRI